MSTILSTRRTSSSSNLEQLDPTTLAISLIPLLPPHLSRKSSSNHDLAPITLPLLAAGLSTLPHNVINAINCLVQELKSLREQQVLSSVGDFSNNILSADDTNQNRERENREKWLENQKVNHLKKSISSLSNLQSTLQARLLTTVDTLSDLQQTHKRDTQQLTDERDGVRAVNQVLKRKIATMERQLRDSKDLMESVLERVEVVNKGDWSIVEHGIIQVYSPLPQANGPDPAAVHDRSILDEELCSFHKNHQADNLPHTQFDSFDPLSHTNELGSRIPKNDLPSLNRSTTSDSNNRSNQRSLTLIVELTEELESLRQEIKVELKSRQDENQRLKGLIDYRDEEIRQLMTRLEHFMGLDGFYVRHQEDHPVIADGSARTSLADLEATPRQKLDRHRKGNDRLEFTNSSKNPDQSSAVNRSYEELKLEEEIKQLEIHLKEVTQSTLYTLPNNSRINHDVFGDNDDEPEKQGITDISSLVSADTADDHTLSRVLADLSSQVNHLKCALKEVSKERDALKHFRSRNKNKNIPPSSCSSISQSDLGKSFDPQTTQMLRDALEISQSECHRLNRSLAQSESRILELQRQIAEQESEFERVAERVQEKLKDQRSKLSQAQTHIEQLQTELEQVRLTEQTTKQVLSDERKRAELLVGLLDRKKKSTNDQRTDRKKENNHQSDLSGGSVPSSSSSSVSMGTSKRSNGSKDPFNVINF